MQNILKVHTQTSRSLGACQIHIYIEGATDAGYKWSPSPTVSPNNTIALSTQCLIFGFRRKKHQYQRPNSSWQIDLHAMQRFGQSKSNSLRGAMTDEIRNLNVKIWNQKFNIAHLKSQKLSQTLFYPISHHND